LWKEGIALMMGGCLEGVVVANHLDRTNRNLRYDKRGKQKKNKQTSIWVRAREAKAAVLEIAHRKYIIRAFRP
jgi:hypothetical protein